MKKSQALELWGTYTRLANALGMHAGTLQSWPEELSEKQWAQIIGISILKKGLQKTEAFLGALPR